MPPKKRTDQTKRTPSTSPTTSTSHASVDQHHCLRHTGPSIHTRSGAASSKPQLAPAHPEQTPSESPDTQTGAREKELLAKVSPPGARSSFTKFLYVLLFIVLLLFGWYLYGMITLLDKLKEEVGWWGIITGDSGSRMRWGTSEGWGFGSDHRPGGQGGRAGSEKGGALESSLNALADALGIPPMQVASAVKTLIPQTSLTSIVSKSEETGGSEAVRLLFQDTSRNDGNSADMTRRIVEEFDKRTGGAEKRVAESDDMI